jgi:uncharacterized membrane protein YbhN (UPF0104 family)
MSRTLGVTTRLLGGAVILGALVWKVGGGPFLDGVRAVDVPSVVLAVVLGALTTVCAAWRWTVVARGLGITLRLPQAVSASYRAQFLNCVLPGGVVGDVHRGVRHGRDTGDVPRALRAVVWERTAGQLVQVLIAVVVLCALPSPFRHAMPAVLAITAAVAVALVIVVALISRRSTGRVARMLRIAGADARYGVFARDAWPGVAVASVIVVAGHAATFLVAARAAGTSASTQQLLPIALLLLLAASAPTNIGGWGPREGVSAWAFATAGLGAAQGLAVATAYGVLVVASTVPGALVLLAARRRPVQISPPDRPEPARAAVAAGESARA